MRRASGLPVRGVVTPLPEGAQQPRKFLIYLNTTEAQRERAKAKGKGKEKGKGGGK